MRLTKEIIKDKGACLRAIRKFKKLFPKGAILTKENLKIWLEKGKSDDYFSPFDDLRYFVGYKLFNWSVYKQLENMPEYIRKKKFTDRDIAKIYKTIKVVKEFSEKEK